MTIVSITAPTVIPLCPMLLRLKSLKLMRWVMSHVLPDLLHFNRYAGVLLLQKHLVKANRMPSLLISMLTYPFSDVLLLYFTFFLVPFFFFLVKEHLYISNLSNRLVTLSSMFVTQCTAGYFPQYAGPVLCPCNWSKPLRNWQCCLDWPLGEGDRNRLCPLLPPVSALLIAESEMDLWSFSSLSLLAV